MKKETNLCMSCMSIKPAGAILTHAPGECPRCGWIDNGVYLASYLYPKTFLAGRYIVGKLISYNGEGALYAGYDTLTDNKITIKEYMPDALCSRARDVLPITVNSGELPLYKTYMSEFIELNRSLQSFGSSSGIQKITDVFSENSTAYAIHEDVSGISLSDYLRNAGKTLTPEQVKELFPPLFTILARINTAGIIHRGISPRTIFVNQLSGTPIVYMSDFAITAARIYGSKINSEVFSGYAAPEQHNWVERHGDWTDVYGLAALLYNALTGVVPQDAPSRLVEDRLAEPMLINGLIPVSMSKVIMRGMELSCDRRIQTVDELSHLLWGEIKAPKPTAPVVPVSAAVNDTLAFTSTSALSGNLTPPPVGLKKYTPGFAEDDDNIGEADEDRYESRLNARRMAREKKRKTAMIFALSAISSVVVMFLVLIILAAADVISFPGAAPEPSPNGGGGNELTRVVIVTQEPGVSADGHNNPPVQEGQVTNFVGERFRESWSNEARFNFLEFEFVAEYSDNFDEPPGVVFYQSIERGEVVPHGTKITIKYSLGPEFAIMPDFTGSGVVELTNRLVDLGVSPANIEIRDVESLFHFQENMVDHANIQPGERIRITSYPGDNERQADSVIIFRAIPIAQPTQPGGFNNPGRGNDAPKPPR